MKSKMKTKTPAAKAKKPAAGKKNQKKNVASKTKKGTKEMPKKFPFWARLKINKNRTTLVIDEEPVVNKKTKKIDEGYVHREAIHTKKKGYEEIKPNPDRTDPDPMYLKKPSKLPKRLFKPHEKDLDMPIHLQERYEKNNNK